MSSPDAIFVVHTAAEFGLVGSGDESVRFQEALDRLAAAGPAVLALAPDTVYRASGLTVRSRVVLRGDRTTLHAPGTSGGVLLTVAGTGELTLDRLALRGSALLRAEDSSAIRLTACSLEPVAGDTDATAFVLSDAARLEARDSRLLSLAPNAAVVVRDRAILDWQGGTWCLARCLVADAAAASIAAEAPGGACGRETMDCLFRFGRPSGDPSAPQASWRSGPLWTALCGTRDTFQHVLTDPAHANALRAWDAHNDTQCGHGRIALHNRPAEEAAVQYHVVAAGRFRVDIAASVLHRVHALDRAEIAMRGGRLRRCEAYGLSRTAFTDVDLIMAGSDDPWHPRTGYLQGNHCMEFSQAFNDLLPTVIFQGGRMDFAGDDCLNGLPEARALQLMEVVHALASVFPDAVALDGFAPDTLPDGARLPLQGQAAALHNDHIAPMLPFDFRGTAFIWRGPYQAGTDYQPGDVCTWNDTLFVCNRPRPVVAPSSVFEGWQALTVAFRNDHGYLQAARRVRRDGRWQWERRQALGPWAGYTLRERGNPIVTYQVHLILRDTCVIRRANTWSFANNPVVPVGNSAYNYLLSSLVSNVSRNTNFNRIECTNVELRNVGLDAPPPIRGLSLGPNRHIPGHCVFENVRIVGPSIGAPIVFRIDTAPARPDNRVVFRQVTADYDPTLLTAADFGEHRHPLNTGGGPRPPPPPARAVPDDAFVHFEFLDQPPPDWQGIRAYLGRMIESDGSAEFLAAHPGLVP